MHSVTLKANESLGIGLPSNVLAMDEKQEHSDCFRFLILLAMPAKHGHPCESTEYCKRLKVCPAEDSVVYYRGCAYFTGQITPVPLVTKGNQIYTQLLFRIMCPSNVALSRALLYGTRAHLLINRLH